MQQLVHIARATVLAGHEVSGGSPEGIEFVEVLHRLERVKAVTVTQGALYLFVGRCRVRGWLHNTSGGKLDDGYAVAAMEDGGVLGLVALRLYELRREDRFRPTRHLSAPTN